MHEAGEKVVVLLDEYYPESNPRKWWGVRPIGKITHVHPSGAVGVEFSGPPEANGYGHMVISSKSVRTIENSERLDNSGPK